MKKITKTLLAGIVGAAIALSGFTQAQSQQPRRAITCSAVSHFRSKNDHEWPCYRNNNKHGKLKNEINEGYCKSSFTGIQ